MGWSITVGQAAHQRVEPGVAQAHVPQLVADHKGHFLGVPYDWRRPTLARTRQRVWNPGEERILVPRSFGWGYDVNFGAIWRLLRARRG